MSKVTWQKITIEEGDSEVIPCDCCGKTNGQISGDLISSEEWFGFYGVRFSKGHPEVPLSLRICLGDWSDDALADERWVFEADFYPQQGGYIVRDISSESPPVQATHLDRDDIVATSFERDAYAILDAIMMKDTRLEFLRA